MSAIVEGKFDAINNSITRLDQPLPVYMNRFWSATENKEILQQFFIKWIADTYRDQKPGYLGGSHVSDLTDCLMVSGVENKYVRLLKCNHEDLMIVFCFMWITFNESLLLLLIPMYSCV